MKPFISGIQQAGVGVRDVKAAYAHFSKLFGTDIPVFEEAATAGLMLPYTGGQPRTRHAILALNLRGGGGLEIWQYTSREPQPPSDPIRLGDLGIFMLKMKTSNIKKAFTHVIDHGGKVLSEITASINGKKHFYMQDHYENLYEVVEQKDWFASGPGVMGGVCGAVLGVSDLQKAKLFYSTLLGFDSISGSMDAEDPELKNIPGGERQLDRVVLTHSQPRKGPFSHLLGYGEIELVCAPAEGRRKIFANRFWGDLGFIHLCFDIQGMSEMRAKCAQFGYPFTVDSSDSFDMGEAAGHFSYIEDPDGTLIEFVETHKVPILKKLGWYLNLQKRDPEKPLPDWMLKAMRFSRKSV